MPQEIERSDVFDSELLQELAQVIERRKAMAAVRASRLLERENSSAVESERDPASEDSERLDAFYAELLHELEEHIQRRQATALGFGVIIKRVGIAHGIPKASRLPLPRLSRDHRESRADEDWAARQ